MNDHSIVDASTPGAVPLCQTCGSGSVVCATWATWDTATARWEISSTSSAARCDDCDQETTLAWYVTETSRTERIRGLNDLIRGGLHREHFNSEGVRLVVTNGIMAHDPDFVREALHKVGGFSAFSEDNDPFGEHDFGAFELDGEQLFFKFDYYNQSLDGYSSDPADPAVTVRVLTIMLASEY
jgi:hypothetical protein